jgi:hypothetical protein
MPPVLDFLEMIDMTAIPGVEDRLRSGFLDLYLRVLCAEKKVRTVRELRIRHPDLIPVSNIQRISPCRTLYWDEYDMYVSYYKNREKSLPHRTLLYRGTF